MGGLISIIIPSYNRAHLIIETLESIKNQTYSNWECIIVDDGSTDDSNEVISQFINNDSRFEYVQRPPHKIKGANSCRNYGFESSSGDYIQFLDSDDLISVDKWNGQLSLLLKHEADVAICKWGRFTNDEDFKIKASLLYKNYHPASNLLINYGVQQSFLPCHVFLVKREVFLKSGLWNEDLKINQDGELFCRVLYQANEVVYDEKSYVKYRFEASDKTSNLSTLEKAKDLSKSWKLISSYLKKRDRKKFASYILFGKNYAFNMIKKNYKDEIFRNFYFYRNQLKSVFINKFKKK